MQDEAQGGAVFAKLVHNLCIFLALLISSKLFGWYFWTPGDTVDNSSQYKIANYEIVNAYKPDQPIPFSHIIHHKRKIQCEYCHSSARRSAHAGVPSLNTCMTCHQFVKTNSPHIKKIKKAYDNNEPIQWVKVHDVPDYVRFSHRSHILAKGPDGKALLNCESCHGKVQELAVVEQVAPLQMGWCMGCHNKEHPAVGNNPPKKYARVTCNTCHY